MIGPVIVSAAAQWISVATVVSLQPVVRFSPSRCREDFLAKHPEFEVIPAADVLKPLFIKDKLPLGCSLDSPWWQLWPHIHGTDGFFGAVFQKKVSKPEQV